MHQAWLLEIRQQLHQKPWKGVGPSDRVSLDIQLKAPRDYWYLKERPEEPRKVDLSNKLKMVEDCVCQALDFDDKSIFQIRMNKVLGNSKTTTIAIEVYEGL